MIAGQLGATVDSTRRGLLQRRPKLVTSLLTDLRADAGEGFKIVDWGIPSRHHDVDDLRIFHDIPIFGRAHENSIW